LQVIHTSSCHW